MSVCKPAENSGDKAVTVTGQPTKSPEVQGQKGCFWFVFVNLKEK